MDGKQAEATYRTKGLRLKENPDGTFTDQYGRILQPYTNEKGQPDFARWDSTGKELSTDGLHPQNS